MSCIIDNYTSEYYNTYSYQIYHLQPLHACCDIERRNNTQFCPFCCDSFLSSLPMLMHSRIWAIKVDILTLLESTILVLSINITLCNFIPSITHFSHNIGFPQWSSTQNFLSPYIKKRIV